MTIEELLAKVAKGEGEITGAINELRNGRTTPEPNTIQYAAQYDPKLHDINDPLKRPDKLVVVDKDSDEYGEVKNINPNVEETTEQGFRIEKVARIALGMQKLITKRAVAFTFGNPVAYNANPTDEKEKALLNAIKRVFYDVKEGTLNRRVARSLYSTTEVAELWYPVETDTHELYGFKKNIKFKVAIFSPMFGDRLYPYFDEARDLVAFSRQFTRKDRDLVTRTYFETYTKDNHYLWTCKGLEAATSGNNWEIVEGYPKKLTITCWRN